jgi:D-lactate dehydrogenase
MKISFVQVKKWEKPIIRRKLKGNAITFLDEPLTEENVSKIKDTEILSVFIATKLTKDLIKKFPKLKLVVTRSTGYDHIDIKQARKQGVCVSNIPTYGENTVAEHTFALILALSRKVHESHLRRLKNDYSIDGLKGFDLKDKTLGVVGAGSIGKHVIRIARGFEMNVLASDRHPDDFLAEEMHFEYTSFQDLIKRSDIVSLHIPYTKSNHHIIDNKMMKKMKKGSILINTSRGGLIDTKALIENLKSGHLLGAGLDVVEGEELIKEEKELLHHGRNAEAFEQIAEDHVLLSLPNVVFTPHIAFYSQEALERIIHQTIENIQDFIKNGKDGHTCLIA